MKKKFTLFSLLCFILVANSQIVSTLAGSNTSGYAEGYSTGVQAKFFSPHSVCISGNGNMYIADTYNHKIRKIAPNGSVTTLAGSLQGYADGTGNIAKFDTPTGICVDLNENLYVVDKFNHKIRKITPDGTVTTFAGSSWGYSDAIGILSKFAYPQSICIDITSNSLYIADTNNNKIRKITSDGTVTTIAGSTQGFTDGIGLSAQFSKPKGICIDINGDLFIADTENNKIRKITSTGIVTTISGSSDGYADGNNLTAQFSMPEGIAIDNSNNIYVSDTNNNKIRKISQSGNVSTIAGSNYGHANDIGILAQFENPMGICLDNDGNIYVADYGNNGIRRIDSSNAVSDFAGYDIYGGYLDGERAVSKFSLPRGICSDQNGNLYVADYGNNKIRKITPEGVTSTFAGSNNSASGYADGDDSSVRFKFPKGICIDNNGNFYITDSDNFKIRKITPSGTVSTLAGSTQGFLDGPGNIAKFSGDINGICVDNAGNVYVADEGNYKIRKITPDGNVSTFAGSTIGFADGPGNSAKFWQLKGLCIDNSNNLYATDRFNQKIRKITPDGYVTTFAGSTEGYTDAIGTSAQFSYPEQIGIDKNTGNIFVLDYSYGNYLVRRITQNGTVTTLAGSTIGYADGTPLSSQFSGPMGICSDNNGNLFISDTNNNRIRKIDIQSLGVDDFDINKNSDILIFPNPAKDILNINIKNFTPNMKIKIIDFLGKTIFTKTLNQTLDQIDISKYLSGIYFITLSSYNKTVNQKFIIK